MSTVAASAATAFAANRADDALPTEAHETVGEILSPSARITVRDVTVWYGEKIGIENVNIDIGSNEVLALVGPSGCGKSTFLRCLNRITTSSTTAGCPALSTSTARTSSTRSLDVVLPPCPGRHGVPEAQSLSEVDLRQRRLRAAYPRPGGDPRGHGRNRAAQPRAGRPLGRGEGPAGAAGTGLSGDSSSAFALRAPSR